MFMEPGRVPAFPARRGIRAILMTAALTAISSSHVQAGELGFQAGAFRGYHDTLISYDSDPRWSYAVAGRRLDVRLEASLGQATAPGGEPHHEIWHAGLSPAFRYWVTAHTAVEYVVGGHVSSGVHIGDKTISTAFQFGNSIGVVHRLESSSWGLGLRLTHYSNADIKRPNPGQNYVQFRATYAFE
jgi:lipid A 3-O-deacylase